MIEAIQQIDGYESMTPQAIADVLRATGVTAKEINRADLVHLLNMRGMLRKIVGNNSNEKWTGSVLAMQDAILAGGTDEQKESIRLWFSHITNPSNSKWDTTDPAFARGFWEMSESFADLESMPTSEDFAAIAALGGGWVYADLTPEQVQDALDADARSVAWHEWRDGITGLLNTHTNTPNYSLLVSIQQQNVGPPTGVELATQLRTMADALEA